VTQWFHLRVDLITLTRTSKTTPMKSIFLAINLGMSIALFGQNDSTTNVADELLNERYKWDVVKSDTSMWLVLVAPYSSVSQKGMRGTLTLMVNKKRDLGRPEKIVIVFNEKVNPKKILDLHFLTDEKSAKKATIGLVTTGTDKTKRFSDLTSLNGFSIDQYTGQKTDLYEFLSTYDFLTIYFFINKVEMRSLIPIKWFRIQYNDLAQNSATK
jgi:hypothetical protein